MLLDVLKGETTERIVKNKLNEVEGYGSLVEVDREELSIGIDWMLGEHMILRTKENYPVLHPTYEGMYYNETLAAKRLQKLKERLENEVVLWNE